MALNGHSPSESETCNTEISCGNLELDNVGKPRLGLGSTANENIALRRNYQELEQLWKKQRMLGEEEVWILKLIDLYSKSVQVNYRRLTKRVSRIQSYLTEEEIKEMENDLQKKKFADKYRRLLRNQQNICQDDDETKGETDNKTEEDTKKDESDVTPPLYVIKEENETEETVKKLTSNKVEKNKTKRSQTTRSQTSQCRRASRSSNSSSTKRPETCPASNNGMENEAMNEIIPSLEVLLDQLHNIKPQQFYENQRRLKLYDIQLLGEELDVKKKALFKAVDAIVNWDKKETEEEEAERKRKEEEEKKPLKRKTSFMRSVLRNFSMELMMKTMQYGWTDIGKCRYLRTRGGDDQEMDTSGVNTLAKDTMKISLYSAPPEDEEGIKSPPQEGDSEEATFKQNEKPIRTADLLGLKSPEE
uniref:non-muscle caldesmon-like n=1 Tax=Ciona intestinalis TaxID=7719 RepID=UPI000EF53EA7|nr:non-muscle caldesmon-like [Ciona intestinalis]|eukprot:XP_026693467.1 non-muscle caldesmon-like [Ciona intestinalis]